MLSEKDNPSPPLPLFGLKTAINFVTFWTLIWGKVGESLVSSTWKLEYGERKTSCLRVFGGLNMEISLSIDTFN